MSSPPPHDESAAGSRVCVVDVWAHNEEAELARIRGLARSFPIAAIATSQDVPAVPTPSWSPSPRTQLQASYEAVRASVEHVRLAQVGLALLNYEGELALGGRVWRFHLGEAGTAATADAGAEPRRADPYRVCQGFWAFTRAAMPDDIWVSSDGAGDLAYLVRYLNGGVLPHQRDRFLEICNTFFPSLYDLKVLAEWRTVTDDEPPLAAAGADTFGRFLALAQVCRFGRSIRGYNAFLSGLGAADDRHLINYKLMIAEHEERRRRVKEYLLQFRDEEFVQRVLSSLTYTLTWSNLLDYGWP